MRTSEQTAALSAALAKAQGAFGPVPRHRTAKVYPRDKSKPPYEYRYATLADVWEVARRPLAEAGLSLVQDPLTQGQQLTLTTRLQHESGEWLESDLTVALYDLAPQTVGSALTYARRYGMSAILGLVTDDDDDGGAAQPGQAGQGARTATVRAASPPAPAPAPADLDAAKLRGQYAAINALCIRLAADGRADVVNAILSQLTGGPANPARLPRTQLRTCWKQLKELETSGQTPGDQGAAT